MENRTRRSLAPLFSGEEKSFPFWKVRMEQHLKQDDLLHTLVNTVEEETFFQPVANATAADETARKKQLQNRIKQENFALNEFWNALNDETMSHVINCKSVKEVMEKLQQIYQPKGEIAMVGLRSKLYLLSNRRFQSLKDLFAAHHDIVRQLETMGEAVEHMEQIHTLLVAIPEQFKHLLSALSVVRKQELQLMTLEQIKRIFLDADEAMPKQVALPRQTAFIGQKTRKNHTQPQHSASHSNRKQMVCFECGKTGHKRRNCFQLKRKIRQEQQNSTEDLAAAVSNVALLAQLNAPEIVAPPVQEDCSLPSPPEGDGVDAELVEVDRQNGFKVRIPLERINMVRVNKIIEDDIKVREMALHEMPVTLPMYEMRYFSHWGTW